MQNQAVQYLVQQEKYRQKAEDLDVEVSDKEVDGRLKQVKQQYFQGKEAEFQKNLKSQGLTVDQVRQRDREPAALGEDLREGDRGREGHRRRGHGVLQQAQGRLQGRGLARRAPHPRREEGAVPTTSTASSRTAGTSPRSRRSTRPIPGSKQNGGKLTVRKGETVPEFDKVAFELKKSELSAPVKTQYGYHIIEALSDVKPPSQTPLKDVKEQIRQQLLQEKRQKAITDWSKETNDEFEDKIAYQVGYAPPATTGNTTTATQ